MKQTRLVNSLSCRTFANRPIESQWIFSKLSHPVMASPGVPPLALKRTSTWVFGHVRFVPRSDIFHCPISRPPARDDP